MSGRGRGRGALSRWEASKSSGENRVGSSPTNVFPLSSKESWEDEVKQDPFDNSKSDKHIRVTYIIDVEHFWAQIGSLDELKQFDTYMLALNSWCNDQQQTGVQQVPVCGQPVCVQHTDTSQWRRAQVTRLSNNMVDIFYLDYGQSECVSLDRICNSTPGDILSRRAMAQYITLEGVSPVGGSWSNEANKRFSELVSSMSDKLTIVFSNNFKGKLFLRNSNGEKVAVSDMLISEGLAQNSDDVISTGSWEMENRNDSHKAKLSSSEQQNRLEQQWSSLIFQPPASQQPSWRTSELFPTERKNDHFDTERNAYSSSTFSSKGQSFQGESLSSLASSGNKVFSPLQMNHEELKYNANDISLSNVPLPSNPDLFSQANDRLETFNLKRVDQGPVEALRSARPHLASPNEFLSHSKGQDTGLSNAHSAVPKDESAPKYQPPHTRNVQTKTKDSAAINTEHKIENFTSLPPSSISSFSQQRGHQSGFSNFAFSPKLGRSQIAAQFQTNLVNKGDIGTNSQPEQQQSMQPFPQPEFLRLQPLNESTRDKTLKAELDWKIWKFQRNIKKVLDRMVADINEDYLPELDRIIAESRLSLDFPGISEVSIILKLLLEKVMDGNKFENVAVRVCTIFRDMGIPALSDILGAAVTECQDTLMEQCSASDCHKRCHRFSSFLGRLYLEVLSETHSTGLKSSVDGIVANCLHNWLSFDQVGSVELHHLHSVCLKSFLTVTGPTIDQMEGNEICRYFPTIRELVLSQDVDVSVKSTLLDILLLRASGWKVEEDLDEQETGTEFTDQTEDDVCVENDVTEENEPEETEDHDDNEEWDPYSKVRSMLKNLKLEDLLPKFFDNCIRDSLLTADWEQLKRTLQVKVPEAVSTSFSTPKRSSGNKPFTEISSWTEAGFPPGVILEIRMYLDKGLLEKDVKTSSRPTTEKKTASSADATQERKRTSKSPSPTKALEHNIEVNKLNQELQQLMRGNNHDKGTQRISPTRKTSPSKEQTGYDGTPYSRGGPRKYVSKAERRRSSEGPPEESPYQLMDPSRDVAEKTAPLPSAPVEPANVSTSVETNQEQSQPVSTKSYSAVLKNVSSEGNKSAPVSAKQSNQSKTFSRPPPGFSPLPTHGGDATMHMTVLSAKSKSRPTGTAGSAPRNTTTRADTSMNWRSEPREEQSPQGVIRQQQQQQQQQQPQHQQRHSGHSVKWRRFDDFVQSKPSRTEPASEGGQKGDTPTGTSGYAGAEGTPEPPPVVQPHRVFGPGGLKACVICGSREHLRCNDRSKMFLD